MKPLPRCPQSLISVIAKVLTGSPLSQATTPTRGDESSPSHSLSPVGVYLSTITLTGRQVADFGALVTAAETKSPFVWTDPQDGVEKLVTFASMPRVLSTHLPPLGPEARFEMRLSLLYDPARAAEQVKYFDPS